MGKRNISAPEGDAPNSAEAPLVLSSGSDDDAAAADRAKMSSNSDAVKSIENNVVDFDLSPVKRRSKKRKKRSKQKGTTDVDESLVTNLVDEESTRADPANENTLPMNETPEQPDNLVLRKLLRGPRYFDPPDSSWGNCYNCGEQGHRTADCTAVRRKKACYYCGSTEHSFKKCKKGRDCYICKTGGHKAKNCPEKSSISNNVLSNDKICLKCGDSGHDMFSCKNNYFPEDLEAIQCYVCNGFGHLCCYNSTDHESEVSCYKCGSVGHTGLACVRLLGETAGKNSPTLCYNCGEGGHFARECPQPLKAYKKSGGEIVDRTSSSCHSCGKEGHFLRDCPSSLKARLRLQGNVNGGNACYNCGDGGHFARECPVMASRNRDPEMSNRSRKTRFDEDGLATFSQPKRRRGGWHTEYPTELPVPSRKAISSRKRGRWTTEDPTDSPLPYRKAENSWTTPSPARPTTWNYQIYPHINGGQSSGHQSYINNYWQQSGAADYQGSTPQSYHQRFPASRFYDYSNNSRGRSNDWWL
ncbi:unnamed protein product [Rhodiola kirilowii]